MSDKKSKRVVRIVAWILCIAMTLGSVGYVGYYIWVYIQVNQAQNQIQDVTPAVAGETEGTENTENVGNTENVVNTEGATNTEEATDEGSHVRLESTTEGEPTETVTAGE